MNNYLIKDLMNVNRGSSPRPIIEYLSDSGYRWLKISDFNMYDRYVYETKEFIKESGLKNTRHLPAGTLILTNSATPGIPIFLGKDMCLHDGFLYFTNVKEDIININFLYYWFLYNKNLIVNQANGSVFKNLKKEIVENFEISVPDMKTQLKIVNILDNINSKLELNNEINNNLLQLCKYKYDELNKNYDNWKSVKINELNLEVTDYVANGSFKSLADNVTLYDEKEYALYVRNTDLKVNFTDKRKYVDQKSYEFLKKSKLKGGELIISNVGDVGSVFICPHLNVPMTLGSNVIMLYETDNHYYNYFLYFFFTSVYGQYMIEGITGGSAQPKFNKTDFRNMEINIPELDELDRFNEEIDPIYKKYELNIKENEKLSELRDTLLPKLMNGEIDLDNIEI